MAEELTGYKWVQPGNTFGATVATLLLQVGALYYAFHHSGLPTWVIRSAEILLAALALFAIGVVPLMKRLLLRRGKSLEVVYYQTVVTVNLVQGTLIGSAFWLAAPYAGRGLSAIIVFFVVAQAGGSSLITIRPVRITRDWAGTLLPLLMPLAMFAYWIVHPSSMSAGFALIVLFFGLTVVGMRDIAQKLVDRHYQQTIEAIEDRDAQREARRRERERFLASASHDLEQPLQAARLSLYLAQQHDDPQVRKEAYRRMDWAFGAMEAMTAQITEHLKLESGAVAAELTKVQLANPLGRVLALNEASARQNGIELRAAPTAHSVMGDARLIERVLGNFVINAVRHAHAGRILIGARKSGNRVRLWVIDDGEGISERDRTRLFEDYAQGDHKGEVRGGYGLGLASAKRMAQLMQGVVGCDPRWSQGAAFWLELPSI